MLKGKAKPHRITRLIVWLASVAGVLGVMHSASLPGKIFAFIFLARATYLLIMSVIYGVGGMAKLDLYCLGIGILALAAYVVTKNGTITISLGILADLIGYIPTFVKTYRKPDSEDPIFFTIEGLASLFGVFAVWSLQAAILFPIYFTLSSFTVVSLIYRKKIFQPSQIDLPL
ncbi:MAG: hypothetical protein ABI354_00970 [Candidatus Saccharimonadales bacterium]